MWSFFEVVSSEPILMRSGYLSLLFFLQNGTKNQSQTSLLENPKSPNANVCLLYYRSDDIFSKTGLLNNIKPVC